MSLLAKKMKRIMIGKHEINADQDPQNETSETGDGLRLSSTAKEAHRAGSTERRVHQETNAGSLTTEHNGQRSSALLPMEPVLAHGGIGTARLELAGCGSSDRGILQPLRDPTEELYHRTPTELDQIIERVSAKYVKNLQALSKERGSLYNAQVAAKNVKIAESNEPVEAAEWAYEAREADIHARRLAGSTLGHYQDLVHSVFSTVVTWPIEMLLPWIAITLVVLVTFGLRATYLGRSFDLFIDEITYLRIAKGVADNLHVQLYGKPFYLHPPAFFFVEAAYLELFKPFGILIHQIQAVRYLNVAFASLSAVALVQIGRRLGGWPAGLAAAGIFALDPFIIKMNSLNLLDTSALWWVLAGYWIIIASMSDERIPRVLWSPHASLRRVVAELRVRNRPHSHLISPDNTKSIALWPTLAAGLLFGMALLTKDMTAFLTLLPLATCFLINWSLPRRRIALIGSIACLTYAIYPLTVALSGDWGRFAQQKFRGIERLVGAVRITGLNRHHGPSFVDVIIARLSLFGMTYTLIVFGIFAVCLLLVLGGSANRLLAAWTASTYVLLGYLILFGTVEEQFFYFIVIPALLATSIAATLIFKSCIVTGRARQRLLMATTGFAMLVAGWSSYSWVNTHFTPDNGYERTLVYLERNAPPGSRVAASSETAQFLLDRFSSGPWSSWHTVEELEAYAPDYLLVTPHTLTWNYGEEASPLLNWVQRHGEPVFTFRGKADNVLVLYHLSKNR